MALLELTIQEPALIKNPAFKRIDSGTLKTADDDRAESELEESSESVEEGVDERRSTKPFILAALVVVLVGLLAVRKLRSGTDAE